VVLLGPRPEAAAYSGDETSSHSFEVSRPRLYQKPILLTFTSLLVFFSFGNMSVPRVSHWIGRVAHHLTFGSGEFTARAKNIIGQIVNDMYPAYCQIQAMFDIINFILFSLKTLFCFFRGINIYSILRLLLEVTHEDIRYLTLDSIRFAHIFVSRSPFGQTEML